MWLTLVFKNLKTFLHTKSVLFVFMVLSMVVCMVASLTVAGMIDATTPVPQDTRGYSTKSFFLDLTRSASYIGETEDYYICIFDMKEKKFLYVGKDKEEAEKIRREAEEKRAEDNTIVTGGFGGPSANMPIKTYRELKEQIMYVVSKYPEYFERISVGGKVDPDDFGILRYASRGTAEEWIKKTSSSGKNIQNRVEVARNQYYESPYQKLTVGDKITVGSIEYTVSSIKEKSKDSLGSDPSTRLTVNGGAVDDSFTAEWVTYTLKKEVDQAGIARVSEAIKTAFGDMNPQIDAPEPPPLMEKQFNNMVYVLALIIILVVLLNVSRLYAYIMSTRRKALAVFSLCGAGKLKLFAVYMAEIVLMLLGSFLLGWAVFHFGLINLIAMLYPSFAEFFTPDIYLKIFGIYIGAGIIIMALNLIPVVRRSIIQLTKEGA